MTPEKILQVINDYDKYLEGYGIEKLDSHLSLPNEAGKMAHLRYMIQTMRGFPAEGRIEKMHRWLGFIQGVLFSYGHKTLNDLKNDSRPPEEESTTAPKKQPKIPNCPMCGDNVSVQMIGSTYGCLCGTFWSFDNT